MLWAIVFTAFLTLLLFRLKNLARSIILALNLPGPTSLPVFGNVLTLKNDKEIIYYGTNASQLYGPIFRAWVSFMPVFFIYEPEHLKIILNSNKFSEKNFLYSIIHTFVGDGLVTNTGHKWRRNRKLIQPYFQINVLENYVNIFKKHAQRFVGNLAGTVNVTSFVNEAVLQIMHEAVFGISLENNMKSPFRRGEVLIIERILKPWLLIDSIFKRTDMSKNESKQKTDLHKYAKQVIQMRTNKNNNVKPCLLDMLVDLAERNYNFTEQDVLNEAVTFMLTGQDSVATALAFTLYFIAKNPKIQDKIFQEISNLICDDDISIDQLNEMDYLEQCIKEALRLTPSIPMIARVVKRDVTLGDRTIPAGSNLFISPFITHRLPHHFHEPLKYDPNRFSQENCQKMHPFAFIPFSAGPRNCICYKFAMLEMKTFIATVLRSHQVILESNCEEVQLSYRVTLRAKGGIRLKFIPRISQ